MVLLENILHYFMVTCQPAVAGMKPQQKAALEANVSFVATEAFIICINEQHKLKTRSWERRRNSTKRSKPMQRAGFPLSSALLHRRSGSILPRLR